MEDALEGVFGTASDCMVEVRLRVDMFDAGKGGEATRARLLRPAEVGGAGDLDFRGVGAAGDENAPCVEGPRGVSKVI